MDEKRQSEIEALLTTEGLWSANNATIRNAIRDLLAEIAALTPDAKLGAAVRGMEVEQGLYHSPLEPATEYTNPGKYVPERWDVIGNDIGGYVEIQGVGDTPEAALKAAGLMDD